MQTELARAATSSARNASRFFLGRTEHAEAGAFHGDASPIFYRKRKFLSESARPLILLTGRVRQAPALDAADADLEWLFRLTQEPGRLWKRYLVNNPLFVVRAGAQLLGLRKYLPEGTTQHLNALQFTEWLQRKSLFAAAAVLSADIWWLICLKQGVQSSCGRCQAAGRVVSAFSRRRRICNSICRKRRRANKAVARCDDHLQSRRRHGRHGFHRKQQSALHAERADQHASARWQRRMPAWSDFFTRRRPAFMRRTNRPIRTSPR